MLQLFVVYQLMRMKWKQKNVPAAIDANVKIAAAVLVDAVYLVAIAREPVLVECRLELVPLKNNKFY